MNVKTLRLKNAVMKKQSIILLSLIILFVITSIWGCHVYPAPTTSNESFVSSHYTYFGGYDYYAEVTQPNPIYAIGTILGDNYPAYFHTMSPNATVEFSYGYIPSDSAVMETTVKTRIIASSNVRKEDETPFWTKTYSTVNHNRTTIINDQVYSHKYNLPIQDIQKVISDVKRQLKYPQGTTVKIVTSVTSEGTINGEPVTLNEEYILPVTIESAYYQLPGATRTEEKFNTYDSREVITYPTTMEKILPFILPAILLILAILFCIYHEYYFVETEQAVIDFLQIEKDIDDLSDWISEGSLPENYTAVAINSLKDLVNLSIDTSSRVIHDEENNVYFSMSNGVMYLFELGEQQL